MKQVFIITALILGLSAVNSSAQMQGGMMGQDTMMQGGMMGQDTMQTDKGQKQTGEMYKHGPCSQKMGSGMMGSGMMGCGMMGHGMMGSGMGHGMMGRGMMGRGMMGSGMMGCGMGSGMMGRGMMGCGMMGRGMMGCGMGSGMMGSGMAGCGMMGYNAESYQKFLDETAGLRKELHNKKFEYFEAIRNPKTKTGTITKLEKEIQELQTSIYEKSR